MHHWICNLNQTKVCLFAISLRFPPLSPTRFFDIPYPDVIISNTSGVPELPLSTDLDLGITRGLQKNHTDHLNIPSSEATTGNFVF